ncbi:MAG: TolC family protein [Candidatus Omnitrophota bacterium]
MKRRILFFLGLIFIPCLNIRAEEVTFTLDEAVILALRDNRDILLKVEEVKKAKLKINEAKAALFPTLDFTGSLSRTRGLYAKDLNTVNTQTTLKQYLYQGGKIINTIKYNGYNFEVAQAQLDEAKLDLALNVHKAFYTLALASKYVQLNKDILGNTKEHINFIRERFKSGEASEYEILIIESSLNSVEQAYEASLNQVEASRELLRNFLNLSQDTEIKPICEFNYAPLELAYDEAFLLAMKNRPEIRQYEAESKRDERGIEIAKSESRPSIYASWDYYSRSRTSLSFSPTKGWQDYNILGLTFSWPVFDGWATKYKVEAAIVDLKEAQLRKQKIASDIALELKNAYLALKDAIANIKTSEGDLVRYQDNWASLKQRHREGISSSLALEDAKIAYEVSLFNKIEAVYDYLIAKGSFQKATGGS